MNIVSSQFSFLNALPVAMTNAELEIPQTPPDAGACQGYRMLVGDRFIVYSPGHRMEGHFVVRGWLEAADGLPRRVDLENVLSNGRLYLTSWQVSVLEAQGRIRPSSLAGGDSADEGVTPGLALAFDDKRRAKAERMLGYVLACLSKFAQENGGKSSKRLAKEVIAEHAAACGEKAPSYNTVWEKVKVYEGCDPADPLVAMADKRRKGNPGSQFGRLIEEMIEQAVQAAWILKNGTWRTVRAEFNRQLRAKQGEGKFPSPVPEKGKPGHVQLPSNRTLQRRMYQVNIYDRLRWRYGEEYANREMSFYLRQQLPDHPLDIVDVDHVTLDVTVIDDQYPVAFGRPDLIVFRDRKTGSILGFELSFVNPSYESFVAALRHAMYPKDMTAYPGLDWYAYGRFRRLGVDNALHLIGDNIEQASRQLGFRIVEYRPGHPWEKGALERLNGIINHDVSHGLPGSTESSHEERDKHDAADAMSEPVLFLSEVEGFLVHFFCGIYHRRPQEGLGFLRSLKGVPEELGKEGIAQAPHRAPIDPAIFVRLAGVVKWCHIDEFGIRLEHIIYVSDELLALRAHPRHKEGERRHRSTKYRTIRDPSDLGRMWVEDPYRKLVIEVRACAAHYGYANGRRLFQHREIVKYYRNRHGEVGDASELQRAMDDYQTVMVDFIARRKRHGIARKFAAFVARQGRKLARAEVVEAVYSPNASSELLDASSPAKPLPMRRRANAADTRISAETGRALTAVPLEAADGKLPTPQDPVPKAASVPPNSEAPGGLPDIEFLKAKHKGYD